jgi:hypothetical protein
VVLSQGHLHLIENETSSEPPLVFLPVPLGTLLLFATFVTAAILLRRRADYHKGLMVYVLSDIGGTAPPWTFSTMELTAP